MPLKVQLDETPTLNLTSMIDVLFLLIIFFMVATKFDEMERNIQVTVPQVSQADEGPTPPQPLVVSVKADGGIELDGDDVTRDELIARLKSTLSAGGSPSVIIRGDAKCAFENVASVLAACRQAGVAELGITVRLAGLGAPAAR
jgi:biopolymer transport protein ExbD